MVELIREKYLSRIRPFYQDSGMIKVLTGVRRCGKSTIMNQIIEELKQSGVDGQNIAHIDLDSKKYLAVKTVDRLEKIVDSMIDRSPGKKYLFIDEIQNVKDFEPLINAYRNDGISVFITGSNSYLPSGELMTKLTGRYIEFKIGTFSFEEIRDYYEINNIQFDKDREFQNYLAYGGYPKRLEYQDVYAQEEYVRSVIDETIEKDIFKSKKVRDKQLLKRILNYIVSTPSAEISTTSISDYLRSEKIRTLPNTVGRHLDLIYSSKIASKCERFDIVGKKSLKTHYKSYVADPSVHALYPKHRTEIRMGMILENIVYNELVSRGYTVSVGKLRKKEIDFVVSHGRDLAYVQVTYMMSDEETWKREFDPLISIRDGFPKYIISLDPVQIDREGIRMLHLVNDFLLGDGFRF